jgi:DNA-binding response OmpR family regulator
MTAPSLSTAEAPRTALVVDPDPGSAEAIRRQLADAGFVTESAATGVAGVIAARRTNPSLVFVARQLNDVRGDEFVVWLRSNPALKTVPVIAIQALGEVSPSCSGQRFATVLKKPLSAKAIQAALAVILAAKTC